jgi:hypothetical protein
MLSFAFRANSWVQNSIEDIPVRRLWCPRTASLSKGVAKAGKRNLGRQRRRVRKSPIRLHGLPETEFGQPIREKARQVDCCDQRRENLACAGVIGGRTRIRTLDPLIKSQLLYQLSYAPGSRWGRPPQSGVL